MNIGPGHFRQVFPAVCGVAAAVLSLIAYTLVVVGPAPGGWSDDLAPQLRTGSSTSRLEPISANREPRTPAAPACAAPQGTLSETSRRELSSLLATLRDQRAKGQYSQAEQTARSIYTLHERELGADHWRTREAQREVELFVRLAALPATAREALMDTDAALARVPVLEGRGALNEAVSIAAGVCAAREKHLGEADAETLEALVVLARLVKHSGRYAEAEVLLRGVLAHLERRYAADHPLCLEPWAQLATVLTAQGRAAEAEELFHRVIDGRRRWLGADRGETLGAEGNLAAFLLAQGRAAEAEPLLTRTLDALERISGPAHPAVLAMKVNQASALLATGRPAQAMPIVEEVLKQREAHMEPWQPAVLHTRRLMAKVQWAGAAWEEALRGLRQTYEAHRRLEGEEHPVTLELAGETARWLCVLGRTAEAVEVWQNSAPAFETARVYSALGGEHRVGFGQALSPYPYLAWGLARQGRAEAAWEALEASLARGLQDALLDRASWHAGAEAGAGELSPDERRQSEALIARLNALQERCSVLAREGEALRPALDAARREGDVVRAELMKLQAGVQRRVWSVDGPLPLPAIQNMLPEDGAILMWLDVGFPSGPQSPKDVSWACVIHRQGPPQWIELAPQPSPAGDPGGQPSATLEDPGADLRQVRRLLAAPPHRRGSEAAKISAVHAQRLQPVEPILEGVNQLFVICVGPMAGVPIEALTDRYTIAYLPSATLLGLLRRNQTADARPPGATGRGSLMAVGWNADSDGTTQALAGAESEARAIAELFRHGRQHPSEPGGSPPAAIHALLGDQATERAFEELRASGVLAGAEFVHVATHARAVDAVPWLSSLSLHCDAAPQQVRAVLAGQAVFDGRIPAEQVLRTWRLRAELVTLSACETALGAEAGGEGVLGFSQALLVAGARSVVLSLWKVDDRATALLMTRFYENQLGAFDAPRNVRTRAFAPGTNIPKAEALAEAKLWLRANPPEENRRRLEALGFTAAQLEAAPRGRGDIRFTGEKPRNPFDYADPHYWAAFVLIGDPD